MKKLITSIILSFCVIVGCFHYYDFFQENFNYEPVQYKVLEKVEDTPLSAIKYIEEVVGVDNVSVDSLYEKSFTTYTAKGRGDTRHYVVIVSGLVPDNDWGMNVKGVFQQTTLFSGETLIVLDTPKERGNHDTSYLQSLLNEGKKQRFVVKVIEVINPQQSFYDTNKVEVVMNSGPFMNEDFKAIDFLTGESVEVVSRPDENPREIFISLNNWVGKMVETSGAVKQ